MLRNLELLGRSLEGRGYYIGKSAKFFYNNAKTEPKEYGYG
jgi:hypothetical protein